MVGVGGRSYATRCHVCRKRKVKCDGQMPSCQRCEKAGLTCTGYERSLEFAFFDGQSGLRFERPRTSSVTTTTNLKVEDGQKAKDGRATAGFEVARPSALPNLAAGRRNFMHQALSASQYKAGFIAVIHDRYLPDFPKPLSGQPGGLCSTWITTACDLATRKGSVMISDSLLAMSLAVVGGERHDPAISNSGVRYYGKALTDLRVGLEPGPLALGQYQIDLSLITCLTLASYEMVVHQALDTFVQHLEGASALFVARGAENLRSDISRKIYYEVRVMGMITSLMSRRASFLSFPEWLNPSWKSLDAQGSNPMQTLIDYAIHLPSIMEAWDKARQAAKADKICVNSQILTNFVQRALNVQSAITKWETDLRCGDDTSQLYIVRLADNKDDKSGAESPGKAYPVAYSFANFEIAAALICYETIHIFLYGFLMELLLYGQAENISVEAIGLPMGSLKMRELTMKSIECADRICQSVGYFFAKDKRMVGRVVILAPFEVARALFVRLLRDSKDYFDPGANLMQKMEFCDDVARQIKGQGLLLWPGPGRT